MAQDLGCVVELAGVAGFPGRGLLVQADEQVDQLAPDGPDAQQVRQLRQVNEPLGLPGGPVVVGSVDDPEDAMVSLAGLRQQAADMLQRFRHLIPPVHPMAQAAPLRPGRSRPPHHPGHRGRAPRPAASPQPSWQSKRTPGGR